MRRTDCGNTIQEPVGKTCRDCRWYAEFVSVCTNGDSEHRADFVGEEDSCEEWEEAQNIQERETVEVQNAESNRN